MTSERGLNFFLASVIAAILVCIGITGCGCGDSIVTGKIVDVYDEERLGESDGTTIIEFEGRRYVVSGKIGKVGEEVKFNRSRYTAR